VAGDAWQEMWRTRIEHADFWFRQWATHQPRDDYWSATAVRHRYADVGVPVFILSGWQDGYKNPVARVVAGLAALGKEIAGLMARCRAFGSIRSPTRISRW
jgi:predicted acyl esterase